VEELQAAFEELKAKVKPEIDWLYETRCDRCGGKATTNYTVYSQVFECPRCLEKIPLFDCVEVQGQTAQGKPKKIKVCPHCHVRGIDEEINTRTKRYGAMPVFIEYSCHNECDPITSTRRHNDIVTEKREYFELYDIGKIKEIEDIDIPHWYPRNRMMHEESDKEPWGDKWRSGTSNFRTVAELYTKRNLWALAVIKSAIEASNMQQQLLFGFEAILINLSTMQGYSLDPRFPNNLMKGTYYVPQIGKEYAALGWYKGKINNLLRGYKKVSEYVDKNPILLVSTQDSAKPLEMKSNSVDYIFTDPPYSGNVQYGELNFVWESWLDLDTRWHDDEIIVNKVRGITENDWTEKMHLAIAECYRVLKPGRAISMCYHDTSEGTWALLQDIMAENGFIAENISHATYIDAKEKSRNQLTADKVTKRDLVINFRKPKPGEAAADISITGQEDIATFAEKVRAIIRDYLNANPGSAKDRIYDEVVSRMVRSGQMEAHDFDEILKTIAEETVIPGVSEASRWYLKETEMTMADDAEAAREDAAAVVLGQFIVNYLHKNPEQEGVHYSDLFEQYIYGVKDKLRRQMIDILPDYFYKTDEGTWRLPASEEEEKFKSDARAQGLGRRVKRYIAMLKSGVAIPEREQQSDTTLASWLRHCKRTGMYDEGKMLYETGGLNIDNLSDEAMAAAEEDYQTCCRMLRRGE
jgi:hypothetical protein